MSSSTSAGKASDDPMAPVRASTRISIAWSGNAPSEDTDTLVLTVHDFSLDLRAFLNGSGLEWCTAGVVSEGAGSTRDKPVLRWMPLIDSHGLNPNAPPDEGSFSLLPNGDVLEVGKMLNPASSAVEPYEEVWRRHPITAGEGYCVLERVDGSWGGMLDGELAELGTQETEQGTASATEAATIANATSFGATPPRAVIGRVGTRAIGIAQIDGQYAAWRDEIHAAQWKRVYSFGDTQHIPHLPIEVDYRPGHRVRLHGGVWMVRHAGEIPQVWD